MNSWRSIYQYKNALSIIKKASRILIVAHEKPDGDATASVCALSLLLDKLNKEHILFTPTPPSSSFSFLPNIDRISSDRDEVAGENFFSFDLIIIVDCGSINRTKLEKEILAKKSYQDIIEFDHHPRREEKISEPEIRLSQAAATTEVLYHFFKYNNIKINKDIADCILTGILTDTANFLHPSATKKTIKIASRMVSKGAQFPKITKNTWQNKSLKSMKLWSTVLNNLKVNPKYNIAFTVLTLEEIKKFREKEEVWDGITNSLNNLKGVKAVIFLRQEDEDLIKGSIRTNRPDINVARLANYLGGGGHVKAAGFSLKGRIEETKNGWKIV